MIFCKVSSNSDLRLQTLKSDIDFNMEMYETLKIGNICVDRSIKQCIIS